MNTYLKEALESDVALLQGLIKMDDSITYNTTNLQLRSLEAFLDELGYVFEEEGDDCILHIRNEDKGNGNPDYMSFNYAVELFNGVELTEHKDWYTSKCGNFIFTEQECLAAEATKYIASVKLQRCTNSYLGVQCQSHLVTFTNKKVGELTCNN